MTTPPRVRRSNDATPGQIVLDDLSKQIIEQLQADGRMPYAAIGKAEGQDVDRVRGCMFAEASFIAAVNPPAAETSGMVDPDDAASKMPLSGRLNHIPFPQVQRRRDRAGRRHAARRVADRPPVFRLQQYSVIEAAPCLDGARLLERGFGETG